MLLQWMPDPHQRTDQNRSKMRQFNTTIGKRQRKFPSLVLLVLRYLYVPIVFLGTSAVFLFLKRYSYVFPKHLQLPALCT